MSFPETELALLPALQGQPIERIQRDGVEFVLLGTAHVSRLSVSAVDALLAATFEVHLAHPFEMNALRKGKRVKTDSRDAYELGHASRRLLGVGMPAAYPPA